MAEVVAVAMMATARRRSDESGALMIIGLGCLSPPQANYNRPPKCHLSNYSYGRQKMASNQSGWLDRQMQTRKALTNGENLSKLSNAQQTKHMLGPERIFQKCLFTSGEHREASPSAPVDGTDQLLIRPLECSRWTN